MSAIFAFRRTCHSSFEHSRASVSVGIASGEEIINFLVNIFFFSNDFFFFFLVLINQVESNEQ